MLKRTLVLAVLHGEADLEAARAAGLRSHINSFPAWRSAEQLAAQDAVQTAAIAAAEAAGDAAGATALAAQPVPSEAYAASPQRPPEPLEPACEVVAVFLDQLAGGGGDHGSRLELRVADWAEAAGLKLGQVLEFGLEAAP